MLILYLPKTGWLSPFIRFISKISIFTQRGGTLIRLYKMMGGRLDRKNMNEVEVGSLKLQDLLSWVNFHFLVWV